MENELATGHDELLHPRSSVCGATCCAFPSASRTPEPPPDYEQSYRRCVGRPRLFDGCIGRPGFVDESKSARNSAPRPIRAPAASPHPPGLAAAPLPSVGRQQLERGLGRQAHRVLQRRHPTNGTPEDGFGPKAIRPSQYQQEELLGNLERGGATASCPRTLGPLLNKSCLRSASEQLLSCLCNPTDGKSVCCIRLGQWRDLWLRAPCDVSVSESPFSAGIEAKRRGERIFRIVL